MILECFESELKLRVMLEAKYKAALTSQRNADKTEEKQQQNERLRRGTLRQMLLGRRVVTYSGHTRHERRTSGGWRAIRGLCSCNDYHLRRDRNKERAHILRDTHCTPTKH